MSLKFPLLSLLPPVEPPFPGVPPVDPQAVDAASFVRIGETANLTISQVVDTEPLPFRSVLFSCFFRGAPRGSSPEPIEFYVHGENRVRIFFYWANTVVAATPRESKFRVEFTKPDGSVFGSDFLFGTDLFIRQNSWHHILVRATINETHDGFDRFWTHLNTPRSFDVEEFHFTAQDSTFIPANTEVGFTFSSLPEARHAAFEPSIAHVYCEISTGDDIEAPMLNFVDYANGSPLPLEKSFGGTPLLYIAGNDVNPLHNYITGENLALSTTDWRLDALHPIVTCCYQGFQHTHLALKQTEEYVAEVVAHVATPAHAPGPNIYASLWFCDCFENRGSGAWFIFSLNSGKAILLHMDTFMRFYTYDYENNTGFSYLANEGPAGWMNYSFYADDSTIPKLKINDDPAFSLLGQTVITSPPYPRPEGSGLTLVASTPTQHFGMTHAYSGNAIDDNPGTDFTDLDTLAPNFANSLGEPIWNEVTGEAALGFRPSMTLNPAIGCGIRSSFPLAGHPNQATSGFTGRCTYFRAPTSGGLARTPHTLFDEITFKV